MGDAINLTPEETTELKTKLPDLRKRFKKSFCRSCREEIIFKDTEGRFIPHDIDGTPHWQNCPYNPFTQKKHSLSILKKMSVYFLIKHGINLETEVGLSKKEAQVVSALIEKAFKEIEEDTPVEEKLPEGEELAFTPVPTDPICDPDEERAPKEEEIQAINPEEFLKVEE